MLAQLIYVSVRTQKCTDYEIVRILESSNRNNGKIDITGVLLYSKAKFLQVLEGENKEILKLYDLIKQDDRHKNVVMISLGPLKERYFPSWQMGSKQIDTDNYEFLTDMDSTAQDQFKALLSGEQQNNAINVINKLFNK